MLLPFVSFAHVARVHVVTATLWKMGIGGWGFRLASLQGLPRLGSHVHDVYGWQGRMAFWCDDVPSQVV